MSEYFIPTLGVVQVGSPFRLGDRQFNGAWLSGASDEDKAEIGAVAVERQPKPDYNPNTHRLVEQQVEHVISYALQPISPEEIEATALAAAREAVQAIDESAEIARGRFITPGSGQAMVYQEKIEEASRWLAAGSPADLAGYPFIAAEVTITAPTATELGDLWQRMKAGWRLVAAQIEQARMSGKNAVNAAAGSSDIDGIGVARSAAVEALAQFAP